MSIKSAVATAIDKLWHPFGKGALTVDGNQYSTEVTGITNTAYVNIETVTIIKPAGATLEEIEFGLTGAVKSSSTAKTVLWKFQGSDDSITWVDLCAAQTRSADASVYADVTISGRFTPVAGFLGNGASFQLRMVVEAGDPAETSSAKTKNSSYVLIRYR